MSVPDVDGRAGRLAGEQEAKHDKGDRGQQGNNAERRPDRDRTPPPTSGSTRRRGESFMRSQLFRGL